MTQEFYSHSPEETLEFAQKFAEQIKPGTVIALQGELGSGKTLFAKGVISQLCGLAPDEITSPTFTLIEEYVGETPIYHVDLYRIEKPSELDELPWDELFGKKRITLIEWPEKMNRLLPYCQFKLIFLKKNERERQINIITEVDR